MTLVLRAPTLGTGMSHYLVPAVEATPNVEVRTATTVVGGGGDGRLQQLVLRDGAGEEDTVAADALFVLIVARPRVDWLPQEIARDSHGFLLTGGNPDGHDWAAGAPAAVSRNEHARRAGGGRRAPASVKRVASAVGAGTIAVQLVHSLFADELPHARTRPETAASAAG